MNSRPQTKTGNTIRFIARCQEARAAGQPVYLTNDPAWLLDMAINRRAGWAEDPHAFGSVMPVRGKLPRRATGDAQRTIHRIAREVNTPRLIVRAQTLGEWRDYLLRKIPERFEAI